MTGYATYNFTSPPGCSLTSDSFFKGIQQSCGQYINTVQICPTSSVAPAVRLHAANQTADCLKAYFQKNWYGMSNSYPYALNFTNEKPVPIEANSSCHYPDFLPILQRTCSFDYDNLNNSCSSSYNAAGNVSSNSNAWSLCQTEATTQYVRCTLQKPAGEVASCVADNAVRVDWLLQIQSYTGASSCQDTNVYLISQGIRILRDVLGALFSVLLWPKIKRAAKSKFTCLQRQEKGRKESTELQGFQQFPKGSKRAWQPSTAREAADRPDFKPWVLEKRYTLKATRLLQSIGTEVLVAYLSVLVLADSGFFGSGSFNEEISFYVVRPRPAPFLGLLGLFEPWSQKGLAVLVVDGMLSFVAGTNVAINYWGLVNNPPANPAAPAAQLKTLAVGAIMTCIPAFAVLAITFLISMAMASDDDNKSRRKNKDDSGGSLIAGLCIWSVWLMAIALFICILPLVAIVEMVAAAVLAIRRKLKKRKNKAAGYGDDADDVDPWADVVRRSRWEEPLTTTSGKFRVLYALFVLSSFVINVGNWIFFASYLKLEGEMYCPAEVNSVLAMWILVPLGIDLLFYAFRALTKDTYSDTHPQQNLAPEVPPF